MHEEMPKEDPYSGKVLQWLYNGILYNSTEAFRTAWQSPGFERPPTNDDGEWTDLEDYSPGLPARKDPPPVMIQPSGPRYNIDKKENYVSWSVSRRSICNICRAN